MVTSSGENDRSLSYAGSIGAYCYPKVKIFSNVKDMQMNHLSLLGMTLERTTKIFRCSSRIAS